MAIADEPYVPLTMAQQMCREAAAAEREACAQLAEHFTGNLWDADENALARRITAAIRNRQQ